MTSPLIIDTYVKKTLPLLFLQLAFIIISISAFSQTRRFVKPVASGNGSGSSWQNASDDIQAMIETSGTTEVWVAAGTYRPVRPANNRSVVAPLNQNNAFVLRANVKVYGGFNGTELTINARAKTAPSILSGDLDQNDAVTDGISKAVQGNNAYHVVLSLGDVGAAILDGFTITGGNATAIRTSVIDGIDVRDDDGGGFFIRESSPTLLNLTVRGNHAESIGGGGRINWQCQAKIEKSSFLENTSKSFGGGLAISNSTVIISHAIYKGNSAESGGGVANLSGGGKMINSLVTGNSSVRGGGMYHSSSSMEVVNTTIAGNKASGIGGGVYCDPQPLPKFKNSIISGNSDNDTGSSPEITYSLLDGANVTGTGNLPGNTFPGFVDPSIPSLAPTLAGDFRLISTSALLNAGTPDITGLGLTNQDLTGAERVQNGRIDLGPYEGGVIPVEPLYEIRYVRPAARGRGDGSSWENASGDLQAMINAPYVRQVWVAEGLYVPIRKAYEMNILSPGNRDNAFLMKTDVKIYGGFKGTETALYQRNLQTAERSILSGDLDHNDTTEDGLSIVNRGSNAYHVLISAGNIGDAELDGFTITSGSADDNVAYQINGVSIIRNEGGGVYIGHSSPRLNNIYVAGNAAASGAGAYVSWSQSTISNFVFHRNVASGSGGGIYVDFDRPTLINGKVIGNNAVKFNGGGISNSSHGLTMTNVVISGNSANNGGGLSNYLYSHLFTNCTISGNRSRNQGGGIYNTSTNIMLNNCIVWGNSNGVTDLNGSVTTYSHCLVEGIGADAGPGNLSPGTNPLFKSPLSWQSAPFTGGDYQLSGCSPLINVGLSELNDNPTDAAGNLRILLGRIDIGAYEVINTNPDQGATLAATNMSVQAIQSRNGNTFYTSGCESLVASVTGIGSTRPVQGSTTARVWIEKAQPKGYVKRHYEIVPAANAGSAEGRVTLYFSQQEFNDFTLAGNKPLPLSPTDAAGKANLRIEKRAGQSQAGTANATGLPDTYTGTITTIDPVDNDIVWNAVYARWEITFNVTGFSGFFIKTQDSPLPVKLVAFRASKEENTVQLQWETTSEINSAGFEIMHSADGKKWQDIGFVTSAENSTEQLKYSFIDVAPLPGANLYKLKMIDLDGTFAYSIIRSVEVPTENRIVTFPNPTHQKIRVELAAPPIAGKVWLVNTAGIKLLEFSVKESTFEIDLGTLASGTYLLTTGEGEAVRIVKQ